MKLRSKLLLSALTLLLLPWAGLLILQAFEGMLRETAEKAGLEAAKAPALILATQTDLFNSTPNTFRPMPITNSLILDGELADWPVLMRLNSNIDYALSADERAVYLAIRINSNMPIWQQRGRSITSGDHIQITQQYQQKTQNYWLAAERPGRAKAWRKTSSNSLARENRIRSYWQATRQNGTVQNGIIIESRIPRALLQGKVSISVVRPNMAEHTILNRQTLVIPNPQASAWLNTLTELGDLTVVDRLGLTLIDNSPADDTLDEALESPEAEDKLSLGERIVYRILVNNPPTVLDSAGIQATKTELLQQALNNQPATSWWQRSEFGHASLGAAYPIRDANGNAVGALLLTQREDAVQGFTNQALTRLAFMTFAAFAIAAVMLLLLATWLSIRIRKLSHAAEHAVTEDGRFNPFKPSRAKDELGDLSRSFARMLKDLQSYTDYLRDLAGKLSHELRTPLAVVRSSLDNLEQTELDTDAQRYAQRAREGTLRLSAILTAMSAAKRIEQAIAGAEPETFDLAALVTGCTHGYRDTWPEQTFESVIDKPSMSFFGMPDLLAQALDKLVDNARDFSQGKIVISLESHGEGQHQHLLLSVYNDGPPLPADMQSRLFDSMVSLRDEPQLTTAKSSTNQHSEADHSSPHLGLGLYIVRLVAEAHNGRISASNEHNGVIFRLFLPQNQPKNHSTN